MICPHCNGELSVKLILELANEIYKPCIHMIEVTDRCKLLGSSCIGDGCAGKEVE